MEITHYFYENYGCKEIDSALVSMISMVDVTDVFTDEYLAGTRDVIQNGTNNFGHITRIILKVVNRFGNN